MSPKVLRAVRRGFYGRVKLVVFIFVVFSLSSLSYYFLRNKASLDIPKSQDFSKCILCSGLDPSYGNSSPNDLVLIAVFGDILRSLLLVRSLRSVGSKASVVIVSNETIEESTKTKVKDCGVEFFIMKSPESTSSMYPHSLRYIGYSQYLKSTTYKYNRILHSDAFDVFFQSDPFTEAISPDHLYLVMEDIKIGNSTWNTGWLKRAYNETVAEKLADFQVSCSGTVVGGYNQFMIFLETLIGHHPFWINGRHSLDQAYHNYLFHTGVYHDRGANIRIFGCNSPFLTMHYCSRENREFIDNGTILCPDGHTKPAVVHQFNLFQKASKAINSLCKKKK